jgi:alpha-L-fucosidase
MVLFPVLSTYGQIKVLESGYIFDKADFKACHASTIVRLGNGNIMAAWFGGDHEGSPDVAIWCAIKEKAGWATPKKVADGKQPGGKQYACWNPVLFKGLNGKLYLHYKIGVNPREWWAAYKVSGDDGKTWSEEQALPTGFLGPIKNKPLQLPNGNILYPSSTESVDEKTWAIHLEISDQNLAHWKQISVNRDTFQTIQPTMLTYPDGRLQLLARSKQNVVVQSWSADGGLSWSTVKKTGLPNPNSGIDAVSLPNGVQLLVYNPLPAGKDWWLGRSVLKLASSTDGINWKDIYTFEDEKTGEYSYPAIIADKEGNVYITYTANRTKIKFLKLRLNY